MKSIVSILLTGILLNVSLLFTGCKKYGCGVGTGETGPCINAKIDQIKAEPVRNPPAKVWQYEYNGQTVYYIPSYCCDAYSELLDANCNVICHPDGGITGKGDGNCPGFFEARKNEVLLWEDDRN